MRKILQFLQPLLLREVEKKFGGVVKNAIMNGKPLFRIEVIVYYAQNVGKKYCRRKNGNRIFRII